jgi:hypothetical protein
MSIVPGEIWSENDPRRKRKFRIVTVSGDGTVKIQTVKADGTFGKITKVLEARFNGKASGYSKVEESANG